MNIRSVCLSAAVAFTLSILASSSVFAFGGAFDFPQLKAPEQSKTKKVRYHGFKNKQYASLGFQLFNLQAVDLNTAVKSFAYENGVSSLIAILPVSQGVTNLTGRKSQTFGFFLNGFPVCDAYVNAYQIDNDEPFVNGRLPLFKPRLDYSYSDWGDKAEAFTRTLEFLAEQDDSDTSRSKLLTAEACILADGESSKPVWEMIVSHGGLTYKAISNTDYIYSLNKYFFDVTGSLTIYSKNPDDGTLETISVELSGDSTLTNDELFTSVESGSRATRSDHIFNYSASAPEFAEVNAFGHAYQMNQWFKSLGFEWNTDALDIQVNEKIPAGKGRTSANNAVYRPTGFDGKSGPLIALGKGDGSVLKNLHLDFDVVSHEFGHHIIFKNIKNTRLVEEGEDLNHSGSLHEGLADFFTFAKTGDNCLGESICGPNSQGACFVINECLRTANNEIKYNDAQYQSFGAGVHLKGQLVSGYLWDIREDDDVDNEELTKLVFNALSYMPESSNYADLILALMSSDKELYDGKYGCKITDAATERGFGDFVDAEIEDCASFEIEVDENGSVKSDSSGEAGEVEVEKDSATTTTSGEASTKKTQKDGGGSFCGVTAGSASSSYLSWLMIVLLVLPILAVQPSLFASKE